MCNDRGGNFWQKRFLNDGALLITENRRNLILVFERYISSYDPGHGVILRATLIHFSQKKTGLEWAFKAPLKWGVP